MRGLTRSRGATKDARTRFSFVEQTVFSDGGAPLIEVVLRVSNKIQVIVGLKIRMHMMDHTNTHRQKTLGRGGWVIQNSSVLLFENN